MEQQEIFEAEEKSRISSLSRDALEWQHILLGLEYRNLLREFYDIQENALTQEQLRLIGDERVAELQSKIFGRSSEKLKRGGNSDDSSKKDPKPRPKNLRERYPNVQVRREKEITLDPPPDCELCGEKTYDTGLRQSAQALTVIPKRFEIVETSQVIYGCKCCHGGLVTAPAPIRIMPGSSYSDDMIIDVSLSKYLDLIPMGRYAKIAERLGVKGLPPQSLIECTHYLALFLIKVYMRLRESIQASHYLSADETPHRMLEGSDKKGWYLWSFSNETACYFECHDTRSGDVSIEVLKYSRCEILLTDKYSGYERTVREVNQYRQPKQLPEMQNAFCNAHARRYFFKIMEKTLEAVFYVKQYASIYKLNDELKGQPADKVLEGRAKMRAYFETMKSQAMKDVSQFSEKGKMGRSLRYFLGSYEGLTLCLEHPQIPLDNNRQEGLLRSPVVGRKTWYGTHSERGANTACIHHSLVESCKMNGINPREYYPFVVNQIKDRQTPMTPAEFKKHKDAQKPLGP